MLVGTVIKIYQTPGVKSVQYQFLHVWMKLNNLRGNKILHHPRRLKDGNLKSLSGNIP